MPWAPGQSGNPKGYDGPRRRRHQEVYDEIKRLGYTESLVTLARIQHESQDESIKVAAAAALAPYLNPKLQSIPTQRFIDEVIQLPYPEVQTVEQAVANIAYLSARKAQGLLSIDSADSLIADQRTIATNLIAQEELRFKINPPETRDTTIRIEGGLSNGQVNLPGTDIIQPDVLLSSRPINGHALAAPEHSATEEPAKEFSTPGEAKAQGPHPLQPHHFKPDAPAPQEAGESGKNSGNGSGQGAANPVGTRRPQRRWASSFRPRCSPSPMR
jgi:hypothetical protein